MNQSFEYFLIAAEVRDRDGHRCRRCEVSEVELRQALDVHHLRPRRFFATRHEADLAINLVALCKRCHRYVEVYCSDGSVQSWSDLMGRIAAAPRRQMPPRPKGSAKRAKHPMFAVQGPGKIFTVREVGVILGRSTETVRSYLRRGILGGFRLAGNHWRVSQEDIDSFAAHRQRLVG